MIGLAKACSGGGALGNYVIDEEKGYELDRNLLCGTNSKEIMEEMKDIQNLNQRATNKTFSLVLSPDIKDGQKLSNKDLKEMTRDYLQKLGIDTNKQQYIAFVHTEKEHKHIHIIANRVKSNGQLISDHHIGKKGQWAAHEIAKDRGLISAKEKMIENIKALELQRGNSKGLRKEIYEKHQLVVKTKPASYTAYRQGMQKLGIKIETVLNKQGRVQGHKLIDTLSKKVFKASEVHRHLGLSAMMQPLAPIQTPLKVAKALSKDRGAEY
ncbi:relaxase/mobilization nuclease domain-containing protein [Flavobacterium frigidarium]|uniref:relaxase/mobilization nuclease domain-containing protein n=1 Tax=Flavobacterium frigidarium TaxID=99286 RepID=UPI00041703F9|nr:relaxase/mobilization nuclease domain-containing protein [Flavobacterium frigidarium]